jgi:hypothetical protein
MLFCSFWAVPPGPRKGLGLKLTGEAGGAGSDNDSVFDSDEEGMKHLEKAGISNAFGSTDTTVSAAAAKLKAKKVEEKPQEQPRWDPGPRRRRRLSRAQQQSCIHSLLLWSKACAHQARHFPSSVQASTKKDKGLSNGAIPADAVGAGLGMERAMSALEEVTDRVYALDGLLHTKAARRKRARLRPLGSGGEGEADAPGEADTGSASLMLLVDVAKRKAQLYLDCANTDSSSALSKADAAMAMPRYDAHDTYMSALWCYERALALYRHWFDPSPPPPPSMPPPADGCNPRWYECDVYEGLAVAELEQSIAYVNHTMAFLRLYHDQDDLEEAWKTAEWRYDVAFQRRKRILGDHHELTVEIQGELEAAKNRRC